MTREGQFIAIEGLDGAGKTMITDALDRHFDIVRTSEPSEFWTGEQLRRALQDDTPAFVDFFMFMADRHLHIEEQIRPEVEEGNTVISDRFADSTRVYQPQQLKDELREPRQWIESVMEPWSYEPDVVIYVDISVDTALERADEEEKYENREMLEAVKSDYERLVRERQMDRFCPTYYVIDGEQSKDDVIWEAVDLVKGITNE